MMNYPKNLRMAAIVKRIFISWCVVAIVFFTLGGVFGYVLNKHIDKEGIQSEKGQNIETELRKGVY